MSLIIHRCAVCEHPDIFHGTSGDCCYSQCASGRHNPQYRDPEVIPTWAQATGALVEEIVVPGSASGPSHCAAATSAWHSTRS